MAFVLTFSNQPLGLGRQGDALGHAGAPKVVHPLGVFGKPDQAVLFALALNNDLGAITRDDRNVLAWPLAFFQHFHGGQLAPFNLFAERRPLVHDRDVAGIQQFGAGQFVLIDFRAVRQQHQGGLFALNVPILGNPNVFLHYPFSVGIAGRPGVEIGAVIGPRVTLPKFVLRHDAGNQTTLGVRSIRGHAIGVEIHRKRVVDRLNK